MVIVPRVLHISNDLYPQITGGTEIFIHQLLEAQLTSQPADSLLWCAHQREQSLTGSEDYSSQTPLQRHLPPILPGTRRQRASASASSIPGFLELLREFKPQIVHFHSWSDRCGLTHARAAHASGARLVITVHAPGFTCIKGNLIDARGHICDGLMRARRCTRCRLHNGGVPYPLATLVAMQQGWPLDAETPGSLAHLLTARQLTTAFQEAWREMMNLADAIHVLADWSRQVLILNDAPPDKVHLIRSCGPAPLPVRTRRPMEDGVLRLVYWGRCHPVKGLHLVIEAIRRLPRQAPIRLDFYGPYWDGEYGRKLRCRIAEDDRFRLHGNIPKDELLPRLQHYDLAVVPSTWPETGPLTVLEAFAANLPVAGSDLGGIAELLRSHDCQSGLVQPSTRAWHLFFSSLLFGDCPLPPASSLPSRTFAVLAGQLNDLYGSIIFPFS